MPVEEDPAWPAWSKAVDDLVQAADRLRTAHTRENYRLYQEALSNLDEASAKIGEDDPA